MADLPSSVGLINVTAKSLVGLADSSDVGNQPDALVSIAKVVIVPSVNEVVAIDEVGVKPLISLIPTYHELDGTGTLRPAADGINPPTDPAGTLKLVAPKQKAISPFNWIWTATFIPTASQSWKQFSVDFTGTPGDTIDLGSVLSVGLAAGNVELMNMWYKQLAKDPEQIMVGTVTYVGGTNKLATADVLWPDGTVGLLTVDTYHAATEKAASWHITCGVNTYTQPAITFNASGEPTSIPTIVVT